MNRTILVVDDDEALRRSIRRMLESVGHTVVGAGSVAAARWAIETITPDMVIMDLVLPGIEGREGASFLLARRPEVPVLFISGYTSQESVRMGRMPSGASFLRKPFDADELLATVDRLLVEAGSGRHPGA